MEGEKNQLQAARYALLSEVALLSTVTIDLRTFLEEFTGRISQVLD